LDVDPIPLSGTWWRHIATGRDVFYEPPDPADNRWQRGSVVEGLYFADSELTVWADGLLPRLRRIEFHAELPCLLKQVLYVAIDFVFGHQSKVSKAGASWSGIAWDDAMECGSGVKTQFSIDRASVPA
jgi:hypothetical protein